MNWLTLGCEELTWYTRPDYWVYFREFSLPSPVIDPAILAEVDYIIAPE